MTERPTPQTRERQTRKPLEDFERLGACTMGPWSSDSWRRDPRHLCFVLARYKFAAKMITGKESVVEIGCGDAIGTPLLRQVAPKVHAVDFEPLVLKEVERRYADESLADVSFAVHDMTEGPLSEEFHAAVCLDVIEHVPNADQHRFMDHIAGSLARSGVLVMGTPNVTSEEYASELSRIGHINLQSAESLRELLASRFENVFMFSMNDEVIHTGFYPMAHYLMAVAAGVRRPSSGA